MSSTFDPNIPDCSNGDYFCKLCLASMNSQQMWSSHIVGKRHVKNVKKYPNGLPNRFEDEDSYDRIEDANESYENDDYYYNKDYYDRKEKDYVPAVRPNVVIDYGHSKKLEEILPENSLLPEVASKADKILEPQIEKNVIPPTRKINVDDILNEIKSEQTKNGSEKVPEKDDFFEKINQRELARDLALELSKKRFNKKDIKDDSKSSLRGALKRKKDQDTEDEKQTKQKTSRDILDMIHEYNDDDLFRGSKIKSSSSSKSSSKKLEIKLNKIDPDSMTADDVDDLLNSNLQSKIHSTSKQTKKSFEKKTTEEKCNVVDPEVISKQLQKLSNEAFFNLILNHLKKVELKDHKELKMLLKVISEAQEIVTKKLPAHIQSVVKAKLSRNNSDKLESDVKNLAVSVSHTVTGSVSTLTPSTEIVKSVQPTLQVQNTTVSQSHTVPLVTPIQNVAGLQSFPAVPNVPWIPNAVSVPVNSSLPESTPSTNVLPTQAQTLPSNNLLPSPSNPNLQNYQANNAALYFQLMHQSRQPIPISNANSASITVPSLQQPSVSQANNPALFYQMMQAMSQMKQSVPSTNPNSLSNPTYSNSQLPNVSQANSAAFYYQMMQAMSRIRQPIPTTNVNSVSNTVPFSQPNSQLSQANNTALYQMMQAMNQMRQSVPVTNSNSVCNTVTVSSLKPSTMSQTNIPASKTLDTTLKHLDKLAEEFKSKKESSNVPEEKTRKHSGGESKEQHRREYNTDYRDKYRRDFKDSRRDR